MTATAINPEDIIPESLRGADPGELRDLLAWAAAALKSPRTWAAPGADAVVRDLELEELVHATHGLVTVLKMTMRLSEEHIADRVSPGIVGGLESAAYALACSIDAAVGRLSDQARDRARAAKATG